jgi:hypothetical protein
MDNASEVCHYSNILVGTSFAVITRRADLRSVLLGAVFLQEER